MKSYNSQAKRKTVITAITVISLSVIIVGLSLFFAIRSANGTPAGGDVQKPVEDNTNLEVNKPVESFTLPVASYTDLKEASIDKLVYMPSLNMWKTHNGVDFVAAEGAEVSAVFSGKVTKVEQNTLEGVTVTVEQNNGMIAVYKSLASASVSEGASVENGATIGVVGTMLSEKDVGIHVHLELKKDGKLVDPLEYLSVDSGNK